MKKLVPLIMNNMAALVLCLSLQLSFSPAEAQGALQFNQVIIIDNSLQTVPAGKVWKATSVYGQKFACWPMNCPGSWPNCSLFSTRAGFNVNGVAVTLFNLPYNASAGIYYQATNCTGTQNVGGNPVTNCLNAGYGDYINTIADRQTILPLWIPAGTTLQSFDNTIYISVIEFNIIP